MFYRGKHVAKKSHSFKLNKATLLVISLAFLITFAIGGTIAWIVDTTDSVVNRFQPVDVTCSVIEESWKDGNTVKKNVTIQNTGDVDAYIRATVIANWVDAGGAVYPETLEQDTDYTLNTGSDWKRNGDYWYYKSAVPSKGSTTNFIDYCAPVKEQQPSGYTLQITVLADAVQADGVDSDGEKAVVKAWGVDPTALS